MNNLTKGIRCRSPSHSIILVGVNVFLNLFHSPCSGLSTPMFLKRLEWERSVWHLSQLCFGGFTFGTGIIFTDFHVSGSIPSRNELLKIAVKGPARILAWYLRIQAGTFSGPVALFVLTFLMSCRVVVKSMTYSSGSWPSTSKPSLSLSSRADVQWLIWRSHSSC